MATRIVWQAQDGSLRITIPADPAADTDAVAAHALAVDPSLATCTRLADVDHVDLPSRRFRACWRHDGKTVAVALDLARAQVLAEVRAERNAKLDASDKEAARLADIGTAEQQAALKEKRQALRDLPVTVTADLAALDTAADLESYKPVWPDAAEAVRG